MAFLPNVIYEAEAAVNVGPHLRLVAEIEAFVDLVLASDYWRTRSAVRSIALVLPDKPETGAWRHTPKRGELQLWKPISHLIICHELAHLLAWVEPGHGADHNRCFIAAYVGLVYEFLGKRQGDALRDEIIRRKVYGYRVLC